MKVAILGSGPTRILDLPQRGFDHTISVGGGCLEGEWDYLFCTDPVGYKYFALPAKRGAQLVVTDKMVKLAFRAGKKIPKSRILWQRPMLYVPNVHKRPVVRFAGPQAAYYAMVELGATEIHLTGCDCFDMDGGKYSKQVTGWNDLIEEGKRLGCTITREPYENSSSPIREESIL